MKRRTSLRAPFVVTLAASAALGCGASVTPAEPGDASVPGDAEPSTDAPRACPTPGTACNPTVDTQSCTDHTVSETSCPPTVGVTYVCDPNTRQWQHIVTSCNPPPPVQCPAERPARGSACPSGFYPSTTLRCEYSRCGDYYAYRATCAGPGAQWQVLETSCNPPPPMCPATRPAPGAACSFPSYISCAWGSCDDGTSASGFCTDGHWAVGETACTLDAGAGPDV